jgi:Zn-finger nucleic acid-binding protein
MTTLTCPKCQGAMRSYERNGITVDQCGECRGIFLDRGELEHLVEADARAHAAEPPRAAAPTPAPPPRQDVRPDERYRDDHYSSDYSSGHPPKKRRKSWMDDLFD